MNKKIGRSKKRMSYGAIDNAQKMSPQTEESFCKCHCHSLIDGCGRCNERQKTLEDVEKKIIKEFYHNFPEQDRGKIEKIIKELKEE